MSIKKELQAILDKINENQTRLYNNEVEQAYDCVVLEDVNNVYNGSEGEVVAYNGWAKDLQTVTERLHDAEEPIELKYTTIREVHLAVEGNELSLNEGLEVVFALGARGYYAGEPGKLEK